MATNSQVDARRTIRVNRTAVAVDGNAQATITLPELKHIDGIQDVSVQPFGDDGTVDNEGRIGRAISVGEDGNGVAQVTFQFFIGGGAGAALDNDLDATILDNVLITAEGL